MRYPLGQIKSPKAARRSVHPGLINFLDYYDEEQIEKALHHFVNNFIQSRDWRAPYRERWLENEELYRGYSRYYEDRPEWQSQYFLMWLFTSIENIVSRVLPAQYDTPPLMSCVGENAESLVFAKSVEMFLQKRVEQTCQYFQDALTWRGTLKHGTGIQKVLYEITNSYTGTKCIDLDLLDFYPDPLSEDIQSARFAIHRQPRHIEWILEQEENGLFQNCDDIPRDQSYVVFNQFDLERVFGYYNVSEDLKKDYHEVLEYWGCWKDKETKEYFDVVAVMIDRKRLVRFQECPYQIYDEEKEYWYAKKPFIKFLDVPLNHQFYGIGEIDVGRSTVLEANDTRNAMGDAKQFALSPVYQMMAGATMGTPIDRIVFAPGNIIETAQPNSLQPLKPDTTWMGVGNNDIEFLRNELQRTTSITDPMQGSEGAIRKTATEFQGSVQEGNTRLKLKIQLCDIMSLNERADMIFKMERQYTDDDVIATIFDTGGAKAFVKLNPSQMKGNFQFHLQAASLLGDKAMIANERLQLLKTALTIPGSEQWFNYQLMIRLIADALDVKEQNLIIQPAPAGAAAPGGQPGLKLLPGGQGAPPTAGPGQPPALPVPQTGTPTGNQLAVTKAKINSRLAQLAH